MLAACSAAPDATSSSQTMQASREPVTPLPTPSPSSRATPEPVIIVGHALPFYPDFAGWVAQWDGLAIVEITEIGPEQWNTPDGSRPPDDEMQAALSGTSGVDFIIGRPIEFRVTEVLRGEVLAPGDVDTYWLPGGSVGIDMMDTHPHFSADEVAPGDRAVAFTFAEPVDFGGSGVETRTGFLFLVDDAGRLITLAPDETIDVNELADYLP